MKRLFAILIVFSLAILSCNAVSDLVGASQRPTAVPTSATLAPTPPNTHTPTPPPSQTPTLPTAPTPPEGKSPEEAILILSVAPNSKITSPVTVSGISDPTFENNLFIQIYDESGHEIGSGSATIHADIGQRGPFEGTIEFTAPAAPQHGRLVVSDSSARDGHLIHLSSVEVTLLPHGATAEISEGRPHPEEIYIQTPAPADMISGGTAHVGGIAAPIFEGTLSVSILDTGGAVVGSGTLTVQSEPGKPGKFEGDVSYGVTAEGPGAVQVYFTSPRDGGIVHLSSVEVTLKP